MNILKSILFLLALNLTGCQHQNQGQATDHKPSSTRPAYKKSANLYDRYKLKANRYTQEKDSEPVAKHLVNFKEPTPTKEPLSRYGNPSEYHVDGKKYEIMKSSTGYRSRGIASWYGTKFHKQRTSSGEPYNMYVMTAAHRTLPLPTYLKVRNLANGREAIVKVNDRGPFHSDRLLDVSYAAAVKLGIYPNGTAPVEIQTIVGPETKSQYYLQAGAFATQASAMQLKQKLRTITPQPVVIEHYNNKYIVRIGPFGSKYTADSLKVKLAKNGVSGTFSVLV